MTWRVLAVVMVGGFAAGGWACDRPAGRLVSAEAIVELRPAGGAAWMRIEPPHRLCQGDQVAVRSPGRAAVVLGEDILVRLDQETTLQLTHVAPDADAEIGLGAGIIHVITRFRKRFGVSTPFVNALVEGTEFTVIAHADRTRVVVAEGQVRTRNAQGERQLEVGEAMEAAAGVAPGPIAVRPFDAVRWAIHYPQIVWFDTVALAVLPPAQGEAVAAAQQAMLSGRHAEALVLLQGLPDEHGGAPVHALRSSLLLALGRVDQARAWIDPGVSSADPAAHALDAIVRVARNDGDGALAAARQAIALDQRSAAGQLALSYALQARRELGPALAAARAATALTPANPFAWARQAELELALAQIDRGRASAEQALTLAARLSRAHALLGFAQLLGGDTGLARARFDTAIAADSADPLARFGRGLGQVRRGELAEGRRDIEIAVLLDPGNAELRSYLGRVYVEEDRSRVGGGQFALARRLDPASPTPWHFDAFRKLRDGDPLGAIADGARAIELNDNRAVLRSSELLDSDRAARSASLGAAYREVGFDQPMLAAAMRALEDDPMSAAGHRLLAESYAETPRFESARLSELLQARLRQPIGQWPVPPQFLSPNLPIGDGPRALAPDEASALFERKPYHFAATLLGGSQQTWGDSVVAARSSERAQVSVGHFDYGRDGRGGRSDVDLSGTQLGLQFAATPATMLYAEFGHSERLGSDPVPPLLEGAGLALDRREQDTEQWSGRLSLRHTPDVDREFIVTAAVQEAREHTLDRLNELIEFPPFPPIPTETEFDLRTRFHARELGLLYGEKGARHTLVAGGSSYRESARTRTEIVTCCFFGLPPITVSDPPVRSTTEHNAAYAYLDLTPLRRVGVHLGVAYTALNAGEADSVERLNAKGGLTLKLTPASALRLAVFEGVKGPKYQDQTLEPTRFAGFNQVFDDLDGTRWRRTAVGFDHRFDNGISGGLEWSRRALEVPRLGCIGECRADWHERLHRAYLALPLGRKVALSVAWRFESLRLGEDPANAPSLPYRVRSTLLPVSLWLRPSAHLSAQFEALNVRQEAAISDGPGATESRSERFWIANVRLSYARPDRRFGATLTLYNIFDRRFGFQNTDISGNPRVPLFHPSRTALLQLHVRF